MRVEDGMRDVCEINECYVCVNCEDYMGNICILPPHRLMWDGEAKEWVV